MQVKAVTARRGHYSETHSQKVVQIHNMGSCGVFTALKSLGTLELTVTLVALTLQMRAG